MSPKGGTLSHKRLQIQSKKSEGAFVDYIIEHLAPSGRDAIVVPDGIVANPSTGWKFRLRRLALNNGLFAAVSLHPFVFKPYEKRAFFLLTERGLESRRRTFCFACRYNDGFERGNSGAESISLRFAHTRIIQSFRDGLKLNSESDSIAYAVVDKN